MTELMQKLVESSEAVPLLFKLFVTLEYEGRTDINNQVVKNRILDIFCTDANEKQTQLAELLGLRYSTCFPTFVNLMPKITCSLFNYSIISYPDNWQEALALYGDNDQVQELITELLSFPIELRRLIKSVRIDLSN